MVFSASSIIAYRRYGDEFFFFKREVIYLIIGFFTLYLFSQIDYRFLKRVSYPIFFLSIFALICVFLPKIGKEAGGARRWIRLFGISFQPSEFAKVALVIHLGAFLDKKGKKIKEFKTGFLPFLILLTIPSFLILLERDLGATFVIFCVGIIMVFVAGARFCHLFMLFSGAFLVFVYEILSVGYRRARLLSFLNPYAHYTKEGFQTIQSLIAIGSGGILGKSIGCGTQKLFFLPEPHTDFIFSVIGEELGFVGTFLVVLLFFLLFVRGVEIAKTAPDLFGRYLAFGISILFGIQSLFHMGVCTGLLPPKGITLPFVSYGGSSLVFSFICAGILLNISSKVKKR